MAGVNLCELKRPDMLRFDITRILRDLVYIAFSCAFVFAHAAVPTVGMGPSIGHPWAIHRRRLQGPNKGHSAALGSRDEFWRALCL